MGWLSRILGLGPTVNPEPGTQVAMIKGDGTYSAEVVGESHYQQAFERHFGPRTEDGVEEEIVATLVFEDNNKHDSNAVAVYVGGDKVGHLPRQDAAEFRQQVASLNIPKGMPIQCNALVRGGWSRDGGRDKGRFGIALDILLGEEA